MEKRAERKRRKTIEDPAAELQRILSQNRYEGKWQDLVIAPTWPRLFADHLRQDLPTLGAVNEVLSSIVYQISLLLKSKVDDSEVEKRLSSVRRYFSLEIDKNLQQIKVAVENGSYPELPQEQLSFLR